MAERKLVAKLADIGHGADWFKKTSKQSNLPTMNEAKIMANDTDESSCDGSKSGAVMAKASTPQPTVWR
jgi:hypothetical protein